jgi:general secretion pathway protein G
MLLVVSKMVKEYKIESLHPFKRGFTLIELLVVITILAILAGAALPYVQNYVKESRISKAKSDLDEIRKALAIYETREGVYNSASLDQLLGRYLNNSPVDPWGKAYVVATGSGVVYSSGPDHLNDTDDDITVAYQPPLALVQVKWVDANQSGAVDTQNVPDYLRLVFSRIASSTSPVFTSPAAADTYFSWTSSSDISASLDWSTLKLENSGNVATVRIKSGVTECFGSGSDTLKVIDGSGILDLAPGGNRIIADQNVIIMSQ